jgi:hypothetical protein
MYGLMYGVAVLIGSIVGIWCGCNAEQMLKDRYGPDYHARLGWRSYVIVGGAFIGSSVLTTRVLLSMG